MKISDIFEMSMPGGKFPEYTPQQIQDAETYMQDAEVVTPLEGEKFVLIHKDTWYGIRKVSSKQLVAWARVELDNTHSNIYYALKMIYVRPEYRNTKVSQMLIYSLKEVLSHPILLDGAISDLGYLLILALSKRKGMVNVKVLIKSTGNILPFNGEQPEDNIAYIIENRVGGLFIEGTLPGNVQHRLYFELFDV